MKLFSNVFGNLQQLSSYLKLARERGFYVKGTFSEVWGEGSNWEMKPEAVPLKTQTLFSSDGDGCFHSHIHSTEKTLIE